MSRKTDYFTLGGGSGTVQVTAPSSCVWAFSYVGNTPPFWIHFASFTGHGNATLTYAVDPSTYDRPMTLIVGDSLLTINQQHPTQVFDDLAPSSPYFSAAYLMSARGISAGCTSSPPMYCPGQPVTRGQMAVFIIRTMMSGTFDYPTAPYFTDVPASHPAFAFIQKLRQLNITAGCTTTRFCPDQPATRAEALTLIMGAALGPSFSFSNAAKFSDVPVSNPYFAWIQKAAELGVTQGCTSVMFCPAALALPQEVAILLMAGLGGVRLP